MRKNKKQDRDQALIIRYRSGDESALDELTNHYYSTCESVAASAAKLSGFGYQRNELISSAYEGLKQAAEKYKLDSDIKFYSFAAYRMSGACKDQVRAESKTARSNVVSAARLERHRQRIEQHYQRAVSDFEALKIMGFDMRKMSTVQLTNGTSLDVTDNLGRLLTESPIVETFDDPSGHERREFFLAVAKIAARETASHAISYEVCEQLLLLYYGDGLTMAEAGQEMNLSESRFSQVHQAILDALKEEGELLAELAGTLQ